MLFSVFNFAFVSVDQSCQLVMRGIIAAPGICHITFTSPSVFLVFITFDTDSASGAFIKFDSKICSQFHPSIFKRHYT